MGFELSKRSNNRLNTVDPRMQYVVREAIKVTKIDFGVICGKRTEGEQRKLVESGASQTMRKRKTYLNLKRRPMDEKRPSKQRFHSNPIKNQIICVNHFEKKSFLTISELYEIHT